MSEDNTISGVERYIFLKNLTFSIIFFTITPIVIFICIFSLGYIKKSNSEIYNVSYIQANPNKQVYAYYNLESPQIFSSITVADARVELVRQYLSYYSSPLYKYSDLIVYEADKYNVDYKLIVAIAQQESNLCKKIPDDTYNCWGWGIHSKGTLGFNSFSEGIKTVTKGISENYIQKGYLTVEDIMSKYTPNSSGSWAEGVNKFMTEIETLGYL